MAEPKQLPRIFLSYARGDDEDFVRRLYADLTREGFFVWFDRVSMPSRELTFFDEIGRAINDCGRVVLVVGPKMSSSLYVQQEWKKALEFGKCVNAIVRLNGEKVDGYELVPEEMKLVHAEDFRDDSRYSEHFANLVRQLSEDVAPLGKLVAVPTLPPHYRARRDKLKALKDAVMADLVGPMVITGAAARVGVEGMGGIGKSVLASALAHDPDVRRAFPDGVIWVGVGQQPNVVELLRQTVRALGEEPQFIEVYPGKEKLRELLATRKALLVLDDVWKRPDADAFDALGPQCRLLMTTRDAGLVTALAGTDYQVQLPTEAEALGMLAAAAGTTIDALPNEAREVIEKCGKLPLALALCGGLAAHGETWERMLRALRAAKLEFLENEHAGEPQHVSLWRAMEVSVVALGAEEQARFEELAVFPSDAVVPESAVFTLWAHTGGLDEFDASKLLRKLAARNLVQLEEKGARVSLHDLLHDYAERRAAKRLGGMRGLHETLLGAWKDFYALPDEYAWRYFAHHMVAAGRKDELRKLLLEYRWLEGKLNATDAGALIGDFDGFVDVRLPRLVQSAVRLAAHILSQDKGQLATQLCGRLVGYTDAEVVGFLEGVKAGKTGVWLRPMFASMDQAGGALVRTLEGHTYAVKGVARLDGEHLVSGSVDNTLKVWNWRTGECQRTLAGHTGPVISVALLDGEHCVSASWDNTLKVWNWRTGGCVRTLEGHTSFVNCVALLDGEHCVSASWDITLKVWNWRTGKCVRTLEGHTFWVYSVAMLDGEQCISASGDKTLKVWNWRTGECVWTLEGHQRQVNSVALLDGEHCVSGSQDKTLKVWNWRTSKCVRTLEGHTSWIRSVALLDEEHCVSASDDKTLKAWNWRTGECVWTLEGHQRQVNSVALLGGEHCGSTSEDKTVKVWNWRKGACLRTLEAHIIEVYSVALLDGEHCVSASRDRTLKVWNWRTGTCVRTLEGHAESVDSVVLLDREQCISASSDKTLKVWNWRRGKCVRTLEGHTESVNSVALLDGEHCVSGSYDKTIKVWNWQTGKCVRTLEGHTESINSVALLDREQCISASSDKTLKVWNWRTGECLRTLEAKFVHSVALLSGEHCVSGLYDSLRTRGDVWDLGGEICASGLYDSNSLKVWNWQTGKCVRTLKGHTKSVMSVALLDREQCISASSDKTLKIWNWRTGRIVAQFVNECGVFSCTVNPEGAGIVAGDHGGRVHFLRLEGWKR